MSAPPIRELLVFDLIRREHRWLTVWEIAQKTKTPERSVRYALASLAKKGVVEKERATYRMLQIMPPAARKSANELAEAVKSLGDLKR